MESKIWKKLGTILTSSSNSKEEAMNKIQAEQDSAYGALASGLMDLGPRAILNTGPQVQMHTNSISAAGTYTWRGRRTIAIEVDCAGNGFVLRTTEEVLIAKDLEELQRHFTAQVADAMLKWSK